MTQTQTSSPLNFATSEADPKTLLCLSPEETQTWCDEAGELGQWVRQNGFDGGLGQVLSLPPGTAEAALLGLGTPAARARRRFGALANIAKLPEGAYQLQGALDRGQQQELALGWLLSAYRYDRYNSQSALRARLICPAAVDRTRCEAMAAGEALTRDLINTPASDMGPEELEAAANALAQAHGARISVIRGDDLLTQNFPMIHTVGRASSRAPRLIDMRWGDSGPKITLVGKGVCFDTGGLNIKPGASMGLMKRDMGGAAHVLGLARMILGLELGVQLRVLIPAVENAISGNAFRPQDILTSRKGLTVEINNTDAEGRLVLADALALGDEDAPDLMICMATLTGAARVAVGPDLAPYFTDDPHLSSQIEAGASAQFDPVWRMPFHAPYEAMIEPGIADLDNAPKGGFAGCITAALFLRRFVEKAGSFAHFDCYGWCPTAAPARPKGGAGQGCRALLEAIEARL